MIYFDEVGNKGDYLLDPNRLAFMLLSHYFSLKRFNRYFSPTARKSYGQRIELIRQTEEYSNSIGMKISLV